MVGYENIITALEKLPNPALSEALVPIRRKPKEKQ